MTKRLSPEELIRLGQQRLPLPLTPEEEKEELKRAKERRENRKWKARWYPQ